jgi:hypothetical protein
LRQRDGGLSQPDEGGSQQKNYKNAKVGTDKTDKTPSNKISLRTKVLSHLDMDKARSDDAKLEAEEQRHIKQGLTSKG